jgi:uncharacterized damage-inducible protein DinB
MIKQQYQTLFAYTWHTLHKLLEQAALLDEADYHAHPGYGHGSIHDLLFHLLATYRGWRVGLESGRQQPRIKPGDFRTFEAIRSAFAEEQAAWQALLDSLSDEAIAGTITLAPLRGDPAQFSYWRTLQHLVLHGMQHHTELAQLLTTKGHSPGDIDFLFYPG